MQQKPWESCPGYNQNDEVFKEDLTRELPLRPENQLLVKGSNNRGIFMLAHNAESSGNEVIVKILNLEPLSASGEVFALKELTQVQQDEHNAKSPWSDQLFLFIKSGFVNDYVKNKWGVIVMRKQPGQQLSQMTEWKTGTSEFKRHMVNTVYERTLQKVYDLVEKKGLVHVDFGPTNILVDYDGCYLIDFGAPSVFHIKGTKPTFEEFEHWYKIRCQGFLWGSVLQEI
ncbi:hypothetical protein F5890DRAFT_68133 [Lentinula detonsa]|uniref:non-specific serine/threonine protein kinase n=1 Tax=Lentinula detonsa TaxID=2804962 RepID=A0AA38PYR2_9AGAR|nr:hypothetical protein F5890DRAFT_68133 [Lentinula detonsa]